MRFRLLSTVSKDMSLMTASGSIFEEAFIRFQTECDFAREQRQSPPVQPILRQAALNAYTSGAYSSGAMPHSQFDEDIYQTPNQQACLRPNRPKTENTFQSKLDILKRILQIVRGQLPYDTLSKGKHYWYSKDLVPAMLNNPILLLEHPLSPEDVYDACCYQSYVQAIAWMQQRKSEGLGAEESPSLTSNAYLQQAGLQKILLNEGFCKTNSELSNGIGEFLGVLNPAQTLSALSNSDTQALQTLARYDNRLSLILISASPLTRAHVKSAYRRILKKYHPDLSPQADAGQIIQETTAAYGILKPLLAA